MTQPTQQDVLIVQARSATAATVLEALAQLGVRGTLSAPRAALEAASAGRCRLIVLDAADDDAAMALVGQVKADNPELPVVMAVQESQAALAVRAMRAGCDDVLAGPLTASAVVRALGPLLDSHPVELADQAGDASPLRIAGRSLPLRTALAMARKVAPTSMPVLISGESGTGKELIAFYLHRHSRRSRGPYIRVNCAALSESLLESELFGHERGAFTGAVALRKGRFERAHGGTLLLDEISETTPRLQAELLRVLEQQDFERVGGSETVQVNVRVIATSNRDLGREVEQGRFRRDLYYRIGGLDLTVPPLRERLDDLVELVWYFVNLYAQEAARRIEQLDEGMLERFARYDWPGNVRQLRNVVRAALSLGSGPVLSLEGVPDLEGKLEEPARQALPELSLEALERQAIFEALRQTKSHQAQAARILGISDRTLREKLRRYRQQQPLAAAGESRW